MVGNHIGLLKSLPITSLKFHQRHQGSTGFEKTPVKTSSRELAFTQTPSKTSGSDVNGGVMDIKNIRPDVFGGILTAIGAANEINSV